MRAKDIKTKDQFYAFADVWYQRSQKLRDVWQNEEQPRAKREKAFHLWKIMFDRVINLTRVAIIFDKHKPEYSDEVYGFRDNPIVDTEGLIDDLYVKGLPLHDKLFLSDRDSETFFKAIDSPEPPNEELKRAADKYKDNSKKDNK
ncbi:DUF1778 domain-containing protein [Aquimarina sp. 2-A2]|uniref:type II toxin -antitoxin system TacA 1-like antitoxin n=1 Tax=Aquimarina sp. 2-A2 TaxID=3382644 RepID=UPI00387F04FE